jgi:hypothetical protein
MKLTAVEWLLENLISEPHSEKDFEHNKNCWDKAELMEIEQIRRAFCHGEVARDRIDSMEYFKETYGK